MSSLEIAKSIADDACEQRTNGAHCLDFREAAKAPEVAALIGLQRATDRRGNCNTSYRTSSLLAGPAALTRLMMTWAVRFADAPFCPVIRLPSTTTTSLCF